MKTNTVSPITIIAIWVCAVIQIALGLLFVFIPTVFPMLLGLAEAPTWTSWMFAMFGARSLGFGYGMIMSLSDLERHRHWLIAMIGVQAIDWIATLVALASHTLTLMQVSTAAFLPVVFIVVLLMQLRRPAARQAI